LKALWTLYTTVTYLLYALVITLVLGPQKWTISHYAGLLGSPVVIYVVRRCITLFFDWRISQQQAHIEDLHKQRDTKIVDLKKATRYDTTQELLQKYGGASKATLPQPQQQLHEHTQKGTKRKATPAREPQRTGLPPPPTANIPGRAIGSAPSTPQRPNVDASPASDKLKSSLSPTVFMDSPADAMPDEPSFAPNAFTSLPQQARSAYEQQPKWYDRILDVLLGEDETLAKNRIVLICSNCRLVNGQAPPGVRSLGEIGKWKCGGCGAWNGVQNEAPHDSKEAKQMLQDEQAEEPVIVGRGPAEEPKQPQLKGVAEDALENETGMQEPTREIPDSEEDTDQEGKGFLSEHGDDDDEQDGKLAKTRVTRSANRQNAKKGR
jgi:hypothetical protein